MPECSWLDVARPFKHPPSPPYFYSRDYGSSLAGGRRAGMQKASPAPYSPALAKATDPARCASYHPKEGSFPRTILVFRREPCLSQPSCSPVPAHPAQTPRGPHPSPAPAPKTCQRGTATSFPGTVHDTITLAGPAPVHSVPGSGKIKKFQGERKSKTCAAEQTKVT